MILYCLDWHDVFVDGIGYIYSHESVEGELTAVFHNSGYKVNTEFNGYAYDIIYDLTNQEQ